MWTAITAAVVMGGLVWVARIAAATVRERERAEDVAELAEQLGGHAERLDELIVRRGGLESRLTEAESKLAALVSAQAVGRRR